MMTISSHLRDLLLQGLSNPYYIISIVNHLVIQQEIIFLVILVVNFLNKLFIYNDDNIVSQNTPTKPEGN